jgi:gluconokinase
LKGVFASRPLHLETPARGAAEYQPDALLERVSGCLDEVLVLAGTRAEKVGGVGMSTLVSSILGVDDRGRAITPVYTYADTRAHPDTMALRNEFDEREIHNRTGCRLHTSYLPARFRWLARSRPNELRRAKTWISIGEYILLRFFGRQQVSYSVASWTGLLDRRRLTWDVSLLEVLPIGPEHLSRLTDFDEPLADLRGEFASRWPALRRVPWFPAVGDGAAANIGTGCVSAHTAALSLGSTAALRVVTSDLVPELPPGLWCYRVDRRRFLLGGALTEGGNVFEWMNTILNLRDQAQTEQAVAAFEPDSHGLTILPFLAGERSPGWADHALGTIHGLSLGTTSTDILRAGLEAVALRLALVYRDLVRLVPELKLVVASGGATGSASAWLQMIADALGQTVAATAVVEASSRGVALMVAEALGISPGSVRPSDSTTAVYQPDPSRHRRYRQALQRQESLYSSLVARRFEPPPDSISKD